MIVSALDVVTMTSRRAFTSAEQLIYVSAIWSGCASRKRLNCSGGQLSSRLHPASMSGRMTVFSGLRIFAVSAMNLTPQKAMTSASVRSEEHTSELQSLMRISYAVFCLKQKRQTYPISVCKQKKQ